MAGDPGDLTARVERLEREIHTQHSGVLETLIEDNKQLSQRVERLAQAVLTLANGHKLPAELAAGIFEYPDPG